MLDGNGRDAGKRFAVLVHVAGHVAEDEDLGVPGEGQIRFDNQPAGSVERGANQRVSFAVTDGKTRTMVSYTGLLPDLFREGQGVVTEGVLEGPGRFRADSVLAKHDETYMPREVADALKKQGHWQPGETKPGAPAAPGTK